jgi:hypothetical protein
VWNHPPLPAARSTRALVPKLQLGTHLSVKLHFASGKDVKDVKDLNDQKDIKDQEDEEKGNAAQGHPNVPLRRGWCEAPGDVKTHSPWVPGDARTDAPKLPRRENPGSRHPGCAGINMRDRDAQPALPRRSGAQPHFLPAAAPTTRIRAVRPAASLRCCPCRGDGASSSRAARSPCRTGPAR